MITLNYENQGSPLYMQIYNAIKDDIKSGALKQNTKLPSKRQLSQLLDVSVNTIDSAYNQLQSEGYIEIRPKSGCYVSKIDSLFHIELSPEPTFKSLSAPKFHIDFSPSDVDFDHFPFSIGRKFLNQTFNEFDLIVLKAPMLVGEENLPMPTPKYLCKHRG